MATVVSREEVQGWLERTKLAVTEVDTQLAESAQDTAFVMLSRQYDVGAWTTNANTPRLVRKLIAALVAAWLYERQYAEDSDDESSFSNRLEDRAMRLLSALADGTLDLVDVEKLGGSETDAPTFFPTDATGSAETLNGMGLQVGGEGSSDIKFYMGMSF